MLSPSQLDERLGFKLRQIRANRGWSFDTISEKIEALGGKVSPSTVENICEKPTKSEFLKLYWVCRALGLSIGEAFDFTVEHLDQRAHTLLSAVLKLPSEHRQFAVATLQYILLNSASKEKSSQGA